MPPTKRRRTSTYVSKSKRKRRNSSSVAAGGDSGEVFYEIKDIIDESENHYLIDWEGLDPATGKPYPPDWQPKDFANRQAVEAWNKQKAEKQQQQQHQQSLTESSVPDSIVSSSPVGPSLTDSARPNRRASRRVILSSSQPPDEAEVEPGIVNRDSRDYFETDSTEGEIATPSPFAQSETTVEIYRPAEFDTQDYPTQQAGFATQGDSSTQSEVLEKSTSSISLASPFGTGSAVIPDSDSPLKSAQSNKSSGETGIHSSNLGQSDINRNFFKPTYIKASASAAEPQVSLRKYPQYSLDLDEVSQSQKQILSPLHVESDNSSPQAGQALTSSVSNPRDTTQSTLVFQTQVPLNVSHTYSSLQQSTEPFFESVASTSYKPASQPIEESPLANTFPYYNRSPNQLNPNIAESGTTFGSLSDQADHTFPIQSAVTRRPVDSDVDGGRQRVLDLRSPEHSVSRLNSSKQIISDRTDYQSRLNSRATSSEPGYQGSKEGRRTRSRMSGTTPVAQEVTMSNSPGLQHASPPQPIMLLQDRVRDIRGLPSPTINTRRAEMESASPLESRSPSLAPVAQDIEPVGDSRLEVQPLNIPVPNQPTKVPSQSNFYHDSPASSEDPREFSEIEELKNLGLGRAEYAVALSMPTRVRDQYNSTCQFFNQHINKFLTTEPDQKMNESMRRLINRLNNVSTHIDLEDDTTQSQREHEIPAEDEANWAVSSSSKFQFLKHLIQQLLDRDAHIAIVAKPNRILDIIERFLIGLSFNYFREDTGKSKTDGPGRLRISIVPSLTPPPPDNYPRHAQLVIALDSSVKPDSGNIISLRSLPGYPQYLAPLVWPLVYCSAEHVEKCIMDGLPVIETNEDRLKATIAVISRYRGDVGVLQDYESKPDAAAEEVAEFVNRGGHDACWSLPEVQPIKISGLEIITGKSQSKQQEDHEMTDSHEPQSSRKRISEDTFTEDSSKRTKTSGNDESHISDSVIASQTAQITELGEALERAEIAARNRESVNANRIASLQAELSKKEAELAALDERLTEHNEALTGLQTRYENRCRGYMVLNKEKRSFEEKFVQAEQRRQALITSNETLKEEKRALETELNEARDRLTNSTIPDAAQLAQAEARARDLATENERLTKALASRTSEAEYARQSYQDASASASASLSRISDLEKQLYKQERLTESAKLKHDNLQTEARMYLHHMEKEKLEKEEAKEQLRRRERGGGMTTRTGSVAPRSPRLGGSPARSRAGSRAPGSRPASPPRGMFGGGGRRPRGMVEQTLS